MRVSGVVFSCVLAGACLGLPGCATSSSDDAAKSNLTPGVVKLKIAKGQTRQAEILEVFGPPDMVTHRDDRQIWTYDKTSYDYEKQSGYLTVLLAGTGGDRVRSSSKSTILIIYFDTRDTVIDYRLNSTKF